MFVRVRCTPKVSHPISARPSEWALGDSASRAYEWPWPNPGREGSEPRPVGDGDRPNGVAAWLALALWLWLLPTARADATLVFNEVMYHPAAHEPALEWVEFYNQLAVDLDVSGWQVTGDIAFAFPAGTRAPGQGYLVLAVDPAALRAASGLIQAFGPFTGRLSNNGGSLELRNADGRLMDRLRYGTDQDWPVTPDGAGVSLAKRERDEGTEPPENWTASAELGGTPGRENFAPPGQAAPPVTLVAGSAPWRVEASGTDLGTDWREPAYNDSGWASGAGIEPRAIPGLFNTGLGPDGTLLNPGLPDPHFVLTAAAEGPVNTPATACEPNPAWLPNTSASGWISAVNSGNLGIAGGVYRYRTTFRLDDFLLGTVQLQLAMAADNGVTEVFLNEVPRGLTWTGFQSFSAAQTLSDGWVSGTNTLEFVTFNEDVGPNPAGFRAELSGAGLAVGPGAPVPAGSRTVYYRQSFVFAGDPSLAVLKLNALAADGAAFYLNGLEVLRRNLPDGPLAHGTPARSAVTNAGFGGPVTIPAEALVAGTNLLAVEVHLAAGSPGPPRLGVELTATLLPAPQVSLTFNEVAGATNATFEVEWLNLGTNAVALGGWTVRLDGTNDLEYVFPLGTTLDRGAFLSLTEATLGFHPAAGDRLFLFGPGHGRVVDGVVVERSPRARYPDGTGRWLRPAELTSGASNRVALRDEIVINEIMYRHALLTPTNGAPAEPSSEQWIELHNRSAHAVDLAGWEFDGGVRFQFGSGTRLEPGGFLVVARDAAELRSRYPDRAIVGDFAGRLSHRSDRLVLKDPAGNPADEVRYFDGGHWPAYADGGGSSLELLDPLADNAQAQAWAASDETGKAAWQTYRYRAVAGYPGGSQPTQWNDFILGLLDAGECLVDDLSVVESPDGTRTALVANGDFERSLTGWRLLGTHRQSRVIVDPENAANHVLHLVATGPQEHMHNHLETTLISGRQVVNGRAYEISFRARWLAGIPRLNTRLYFNRVARTTVLPMPALNGTPGAPNSRRVANLGPTFTGFTHQPVIPGPGEAVTVTVVPQDPQGVATASLWWSVNGGAWRGSPLVAGAEGQYAGTIPAQTAGAIVQFYAEATDTAGAKAAYPPAGPDSGAFYMAKDGQADLRRGHNLRLILSPANRNLLHAFTNVMSNEELPSTVVYDERRAYYDVGLRLKGSQRGRYSDTRVSYHLNFQPDDLFRGVHPFMLIDRSGAGDSTGNKQLEVLIKHLLLRAGGIPGTHPDLCRVIAPRNTHTSSAILSPRHEDEFIETAYPDGGEGTLFELELIYYPVTANAAGYKNPQPDNVLGVDLSDLGPDPEFYRYNFLIKNHRDTDDYSKFMRFARTLSLSGTALDRQSQSVMEVDAWMRAWALVTLCGVGDSYTFGNDHNLMMYVRPDDGRVVPFPVDMDFAFVRGPNDGLVGDRNLSRVINLPANLRRFYGHLLDIIATAYNPAYMAAWVTHYNRFVPDQSYSWVTDYIRQRGQYATSVINSAGGNAAFAVNGPALITTAANLVTLSGTAPVRVQGLRLNGVEWPVSWTSMSQWTLEVPVSEPTNRWAIEAVSVRGQVLSNLTATVTVHYTGGTPDPTDQVVFNEIMYNPAAPGAAFVELYNASPNRAFDLSAWRVDGLDFTFLPGSVIGPGQFLVLASDLAGFAAAYPATTPWPLAEFPGNLRNEGEVLTLLRPGPEPGQEQVVDQVEFRSQPPWPTAANGLGPSLQLIDATQDNRRAANWAAASVEGTGAPRWVQVVAQGTASSSTFYIYLESAGDLYLDDLRIVPGSVPDVGANALRNGDFESPLSGTWVVSPNHAASDLSTTIKRSGNASLHLVASSGGSTRASSIYQELSPALASGQPYTLSFWYRQSTNGGPLTLRLSGWGITATIDPAPTVTGPYSPGTANSVAGGLAPFPTLWLNEVQPLNLTGPLDNAGDREPWIELFNAGTNAVSLAGLYLSNDPTNLLAWPFPPDVTIEAGAFLVVWLDGEPAEAEAANPHAGFRLEPSGGVVTLARAGSGAPEVLDDLPFGPVAADQSLGCLPAGQPIARRLLYRATPGAANSAALPPLPVFINEWMAANTSASGVADPADNRFQDWFELYNPGSAPVDLEGWFLSDSVTNRFGFRIPAGYVLPRGGYLLVWADEEPDQNRPDRPDLHVDFRLNQDGEALLLSAPDGTVVDSVVFGPQTPNVSQGRAPDGAVTVKFLPSPTPRSSNEPGGPPSAPAFAAIEARLEDAVRLVLTTVPGRTYRIEYADDLASTDWQPLGPAQVAIDASLTFLDTAGPRPQRFYRAIRLP